MDRGGGGGLASPSCDRGGHHCGQLIRHPPSPPPLLARGIILIRGRNARPGGPEYWEKFRVGGGVQRGPSRITLPGLAAAASDESTFGQSMFILPFLHPPSGHSAQSQGLR